MDEDKPGTLAPDVLEMIAQTRETIKRSRQLPKDSEKSATRHGLPLIENSKI
jgi:hypothetical protein